MSITIKKSLLQKTAQKVIPLFTLYNKHHFFLNFKRKRNVYINICE